MPPKTMEPREANSRPSRLSLIADLREGLLEYEPSSFQSDEPRSTMDWDEEEGTPKTKAIPRLRKLVEKASRRTLLGRKPVKGSPLLSPTHSIARTAPGTRPGTPLSSPMGTTVHMEPPVAFRSNAGAPSPKSMSPGVAPPLPDNAQQAFAAQLAKYSIDEASTHKTTPRSDIFPAIASPRTSRISRQSGSTRNRPTSDASTPSLTDTAPSRPSYTSNVSPEEILTPASAQTTPPLDPEDDPSWNAAVARVKQQMRKGQEKERRDRKVQAKAEIKAIRTALEPERKFRWGKSAISKLITRSSAYGWQLKGDPNNYTDEEWNFIIDALNKDDTTPLRDRLFEKIGTIGVHSSAVQKFVESHQQPIKSPVRIAPIGLGIRPESSEIIQDPAKRAPMTPHSPTEDEGVLERQRELRAMPSLPDSFELSDTSSMRRRKSLEALTDGFGTTEFDPRMSRIMSVDVKKYLKIPLGNDKTSMASGLAVRKISDTLPPDISARELSALKTAAAVAGCYRNVREAENFQSIVEDQERRLAQFAASSRDQASTEDAERRGRTAEPNAQPKVVTEQRPSLIPKPKPSYQALRLTSQIHAARSHESLIPRPMGGHPASRLPLITPERKLTAIHPALRLITSSAPGAASKSPTPTRIASLRKSQSAFGLGTGFARIQGPTYAVATRSNTAIKNSPTKSPANLDGAPAAQDPSALGSLPPSPGSSVSATEIIGPKSEHATFGPPPQDRSLAANETPEPSTSIDFVPDGIVGRRRSMTASMLSASSRRDLSGLHTDILSTTDNSDVFGLGITGTHASDRADSATLPPLVPSRNPARLWIAPSSSVPPQQVLASRQGDLPDKSLSSGRALQDVAQQDTPTRPSKNRVVEHLNTTVAARAEALRQLSSEGNTCDGDGDRELDDERAHESDDASDSESERPLSNLLTSREEWIRTGPSADTASSTRFAPSRLYIPPQVSQSIVSRKPLAHHQELASPLPQPSPAAADTEQQDSPVPAPLRTSSGTLGLTPARTRGMQNRMPETPSNRRLLDRSTAAFAILGRRAVTSPTDFTSELLGTQRPMASTTTPSRGIVRAPTTSQEHLERVRRDQERTMVTETIRLGQALNSPSLASAMSAPLAQCEFPSPRTKRADTGTSNNTSSNSIRSRPLVGHPFNTDPIEQYAFDRRDRQESSARTRMSAEFDSVHSMLDQMSPTASKQSRESARSSRSDSSIERDFIRHDLGLRPLRDCEAGEPRHPKHPYEWDTVKVMCRNIHNPGTVLPHPPDIPTSKPVHMSDFADEFFVGMPHTVSPTIGPRKCRTCPSYCCHYADLLAHADVPTTDIVVASSSRRVNEAVECLRSRKPNGMEEFETFLQCSFCQNEYCPKCIVLCAESMCQQPICRWCRDATEYCDDHNIF